MMNLSVIIMSDLVARVCEDPQFVGSPPPNLLGPPPPPPVCGDPPVCFIVCACSSLLFCLAKAETRSNLSVLQECNIR